MEGISLFKKMRDAQKLPMDNPDRKAMVDSTSTEYSKFLQQKYGMDPTMATLWVTKAKYQDAFIYGELARTTQNKDGSIHQETLADINQRNDNGWKMKTTFQYFYSNMDQIPEDFREKYQQNGNELYTDQQLVSAFIASFTNNGLNELYHGLLDRKLVISRDEAIEQLQASRPDLDIKSIVDEDKKWKDPQNPDATYKVSANDVLEFLYEENVGQAIVTGKNQTPDRVIPKIQHEIAVRDGVEATRSKDVVIVDMPASLRSVIDISKIEVTSKDIQGLVESVRNKQNSQEIQQHIDEVNKNSEGR